MFKRRIGTLLFFGGVVLVGFQVYLWMREGVWSPYSLSTVMEGAIRGTGDMISDLPFVEAESARVASRFRISDFPGSLRRFCDAVPLSVLLVGTGHFFLRWNKIFGISR